MSNPTHLEDCATVIDGYADSLQKEISSGFVAASQADEAELTRIAQADMAALRAGAAALRKLDGAEPLYWLADDTELGISDLKEWLKNEDGHIAERLDTIAFTSGLTLAPHQNRYGVFIPSKCDENGTMVEGSWEVFNDADEAETAQVNALRDVQTEGGAA